MMDWSGWLALIGPLSVVAALVLMGLLSRRFARAAGRSSSYRLFFVAALLVAAGLIARLATLTANPASSVFVDPSGRLLLYHGLPALGITLGLIAAWRHWSWLLAERD